jgi:mRNA-degrading endonuclease RelE of RelBE toxin-antitoxin system
MLNEIIHSDGAQGDLKKLDSTTLAVVRKRIDRLAGNPLAGKFLQGDLARLQSVHAAAKRFRIIYAYDKVSATITIIAVGPRQGRNHSDPYARAKRRT